MPAWCMSLHPYALKSSSKSSGIPSSRDGVFSICSREAKGYRVDAMTWSGTCLRILVLHKLELSSNINIRNWLNSLTKIYSSSISKRFTYLTTDSPSFVAQPSSPTRNRRHLGPRLRIDGGTINTKVGLGFRSSHPQISSDSTSLNYVYYWYTPDNFRLSGSWNFSSPHCAPACCYA